MTAALSEVDITAELARRPIRPRDYADETRAYGQLAQTVGDNSQDILQTLAEVAHDLCRTDSADTSLGISLIESHDGEWAVRWEALAGVYAAARHSTMPRHASPCGTTIDRNAALLLSLPERAYPALKATPPIVEALLVPFSVAGKPIGTVWLVTHSDKRQFDREDERILSVIAQFASACRQLRQALETAKQRADQKDEFVAMLAHELRSPLGPIRQAGAILRMRTVKDPSLEWCSRMLERQTSHMSRLVDDLLDVARITTGKLQLQKQSLDLGEILVHAVELSRPIVDARKHSLTAAMTQEPFLMEADGLRLTQVFSNLLNNAAMYMMPGGQIRLCLVREGKEAVVSVRDAGMGIPPAMLRRIFEPFVQVETAGAREEAGLGLGLMLAKMLVELHHGSITAFSEGMGKGSEFVVRLPLLDSSTQPPQPGP